MKTLLSALYTLSGVILCALLLFHPLGMVVFGVSDFWSTTDPVIGAVLCGLSALWILWTVTDRITKTGKYK